MCCDSGHSLRACRLAGLLAHVFGLHVHSTSHAKPGSDGRVFLCGGERCVYVSSWAGKHSQFIIKAFLEPSKPRLIPVMVQCEFFPLSKPFINLINRHLDGRK
jgi:hypothetical protein